MNDYYDLNDPVVIELVKARTALLYLKPLLGQTALQMDLIILESDEWCKTAATDGRAIYFYRNFVISLFFDANSPQTKMNGHNRLVALMAHEIWHLMFGHLIRRGNRDPRYWNMAIDFIVNATIVHDKIGLLPSTALLDSRFTIDHTAYEVYDYIVSSNMPVADSIDIHIEPSSPNGSGDGDDTTTMTDVAVAGLADSKGGAIRVESGKEPPAPMTPEEAKSLADRARMMAVKIMHDEEGAGSLPAALAREVADLIDTKMDWRDLLNSSLRSIQPHEYTYDELSDVTWASWLYHRRRWYPGCGVPKGYCAILPTLTEGERVEATIAIDTSASMTNKMIADILAEVGGILETFKEVELRVLCFDGEVSSVETFRETDLSALKDYKKKKVKGGGGTEFMVVWDYLKKEKIKPERLIVCTDGEPCGKWGDPNYCDTIFLIHAKGKTKKKAPFGRTAYLD